MTREISLRYGSTALVDDGDYDLVADEYWVEKRSRAVVYAFSRYMVGGEKRELLMHRVILGLQPADGVTVDHINGDGLDCRRENMRICTVAENVRNRKKVIYSERSPYKGVSQKLSSRRWQAYIWYGGKTRKLGSFATAEEAAMAYDAAARIHFGAFACVNFPVGSERGALIP